MTPTHLRTALRSLAQVADAADGDGPRLAALADAFEPLRGASLERALRRASRATLDALRARLRQADPAGRVLDAALSHLSAVARSEADRRALNALRHACQTAYETVNQDVVGEPASDHKPPADDAQASGDIMQQHVADYVRRWSDPDLTAGAIERLVSEMSDGPKEVSVDEGKAIARAVLGRSYPSKKRAIEALENWGRWRVQDRESVARISEHLAAKP